MSFSVTMATAFNLIRVLAGWDVHGRALLVSDRLRPVSVGASLGGQSAAASNQRAPSLLSRGKAPPPPAPRLPALAPLLSL